MTAANHNRLAPQLVRHLIVNAGGESDCLVALESIVLGIMLHHRPAPGEAAEFLDLMTARVIERMHALRQKGST